MTKIAGALNMLPKTMLRHNITNPSTNETIKIYKADRDYPRFYNNFLRNSDNGRSSVLFQATYYQVQNIHAYLHEVVEVRQQILKAFLILNVGEHCYAII
jgi:hypothetical protein